MISWSQTLLEYVWPGIVAGGLATSLLPWLRRDWQWARVFLLGITIVLMGYYVSWRLSETIPPVGLTADFAFAILFAAVEAVSIFGAMVNLMFLCRTKDRTPEVEQHLPALRARPKLPLIDVFICTYNEEEAILERTIIGAMAMDYANFRVWICDDGKRVWLKELCERLDCGYITRTDNAHAKAGNINNALKVVGAMPERPEYISILDADFVPRPQFLIRAMSLFHDQTVGVVQTPQHFINADPIQANLSVSHVWPDEQRFFFDVIMASKDAWDAAFCCGTSSIIRYQPLLDIGGFPTDSVTEDYLVTLRLKESGYRTVYLNEPLTLGLAPEGLKEYITQRGRWCLGFMQIFRGRSGPFSLQTKLTPIDRVSLLESFINWAATYSYRLLGMVVPMAYLLFGIRAVQADVKDMVQHFLPLFMWHSIVIAWIAQGRILLVMTDVCHLIVAPAVIKSVAIGLLKPKGQKFKVTAKGGDRSRGFIEWPLLRTFLILLVLTILGVDWAFLTDTGTSQDEASVLALAWSWYNIVILTVTCYVCIEQPRRRKSERFETAETVELIVPGLRGSVGFRLADLSVSGARLAGRSPAPYGTKIGVMIADHMIEAVLVRAGTDSFAVHFDDTLGTRYVMTRHLYSGRFVQAFQGMKPAVLGRAVIGRLFG